MLMKSILLAEDSPDDQALILRSLKKKNISHPVYIANDGVEALDYVFGTGTRAQAGKIDPAVVLLDLKMPRMNGLEVLERLRADSRTKRIPVVMLTTSDSQSDLLRSYDLGVNSYIRKPVDFGQFSDAIAALARYWLLINEGPPSEPSGA